LRKGALLLVFAFHSLTAKNGWSGSFLSRFLYNLYTNNLSPIQTRCILTPFTQTKDDRASDYEVKLVDKTPSPANQRGTGNPTNPLVAEFHKHNLMYLRPSASKENKRLIQVHNKDLPVAGSDELKENRARKKERRAKKKSKSASPLRSSSTTASSTEPARPASAPPPVRTLLCFVVFVVLCVIFKELGKLGLWA
jgi:hypothetical protein